MIYAKDGGGLTSERIEASPENRGRGYCPLCNERQVAKCGEINIWHWAHKTMEDCDGWAETETKWHIDWKMFFSHHEREVVVGNHRADIKLKTGRVIEFQNSPISPEEIRERENHYGDMVWVFNAGEYNLDFRDKGDFVSFRWRHPRKSLWACTKPVFFHVNSSLFWVKKIYPECPCGGWGHPMSKANFSQLVYGLVVDIDGRRRYLGKS